MRVLVDPEVLKILLAGACEVDFVENFFRRPPISNEGEYEVPKPERAHDDVIERRAHRYEAFARIEPVARSLLVVLRVRRPRRSGWNGGPAQRRFAGA